MSTNKSEFILVMGSTKAHLNSGHSLPKCLLDMSCLQTTLVSPSFQISHPTCLCSCSVFSVYRDLCSCFRILSYMYFIVSILHFWLPPFYCELPIPKFISTLKITRARAQWWRALAPLTEGTGSVPSIHSVSQLPVIPALENQTPSSGHFGYLHACGTHTNAQT